MRIILVGKPVERARLRAEINKTGFQVVGEFDTLADAGAATTDVDAVILARNVGLRAIGEHDTEWIEDPLTPREIECTRVTGRRPS